MVRMSLMLRSGKAAGAPNANPACFHQHSSSGGVPSLLDVVTYVVDQNVNRAEFADNGLDCFVNGAIVAHIRCSIHASTSGGLIVESLSDCSQFVLSPLVSNVAIRVAELYLPPTLRARRHLRLHGKGILQSLHQCPSTRQSVQKGTSVSGHNHVVILRVSWISSHQNHILPAEVHIAL